MSKPVFFEGPQRSTSDKALAAECLETLQEMGPFNGCIACTARLDILADG